MEKKTKARKNCPKIEGCKNKLNSKQKKKRSPTKRKHVKNKNKIKHIWWQPNWEGRRPNLEDVFSFDLCWVLASNTSSGELLKEPLLSIESWLFNKDSEIMGPITKGRFLTTYTTLTTRVFKRIFSQGTIGCTPNSVHMVFIVFSRDSWG